MYARRTTLSCCSFNKQLEEAREENCRLLALPAGDLANHNNNTEETTDATIISNLSVGVTSVCGVLLHSLVELSTQQRSHHEAGLVLVGSTRRNLRSLALAVASGRHVLLEGAVGCGKTALVDHLAASVGRITPPQITKVQLGDQTDSKVRIDSVLIEGISSSCLNAPPTMRCCSFPWLFATNIGPYSQNFFNQF